MSREMMTTKEAAEYLSLNEKKVYALIKEGKIPCTKVTGKWVFPKSLIDRWIEDDVLGVKEPKAGDSLAIAGSHDLSVDLLASEFNRIFPELILLSANLGSIGGLLAIRRGRAHVAGSHLLDSETNEYNLPYLPRYLPKLEAVVVCLVHREQGLMVPPGNPLGIGGLEDLCRPQVRFVNRQEGAGTRVLLDHHLKRLGIESSRIEGYGDRVSTHTEVAATVRSNRADAGLGIRAAALAFGLDFVPVAKERFDLIMSRAVFYSEPIQKLLEVIRSEGFVRRVEQMGGYDVQDAGKVLVWG